MPITTLWILGRNLCLKETIVLQLQSMTEQVTGTNERSITEQK